MVQPLKVTIIACWITVLYKVPGKSLKRFLNLLFYAPRERKSNINSKDNTNTISTVASVLGLVEFYSSTLKLINSFKSRITLLLMHCWCFNSQRVTSRAHFVAATIIFSNHQSLKGKKTTTTIIKISSFFPRKGQIKVVIRKRVGVTAALIRLGRKCLSLI
jgi:hypothetical protein